MVFFGGPRRYLAYSGVINLLKIKPVKQKPKAYINSSYRMLSVVKALLHCSKCLPVYMCTI